MSFARASDQDWQYVPAGEYEIGLHRDAARALAEDVARQAREADAADPDLLHPGRVDALWGNADHLYGLLAHSIPAHRVTLPEFAIARAPVSRTHYDRFCAETGAAAPEASAEPGAPVTGVSWAEAAAFARWAGAELPGEAMWEVALRRGGSPFGPIGHALHEWCADAFAPYPGADPIAIGRIAPPPGGWWGTRTRRGGALPGFPATVVTRRGADPTLRLRDTTFRLVRR